MQALLLLWKLWYSFFLTYFTFFVIIDHFFKKVTLIFWQTQIDHLCRLSEIFIFEQGLYPHAFARTTGAIHKLHYAGFWLNQNYKKVLRLKIKSCHEWLLWEQCWGRRWCQALSPVINACLLSAETSIPGHRPGIGINAFSAPSCIM